MTQVRLILLRHGQSEWNAAGIFTGWENAHLTGAGEEEATRAGMLLAEYGVLPAFAHTSLQRRTIRTADLALAAADRDWIPVRRSWRLNGRHYGALQGRNKAQVLQEYGEQQFTLWRRSYHASPPPFSAAAEAVQAGDPRYEALPPEARPRAESLRDVSARLLPYWYDAIVPDLRAAAACSSSPTPLRALVGTPVDTDDQIAELDIPTGIPLAYQLGPDLRPDTLGPYLDPHAAGPIEAIKNQGASRAPSTRRINEQQTDDEAPRIVVRVVGHKPSRTTPGWSSPRRSPRCA
jgi:2,3-bisphosphoglycerate-dependent phosphoglycerate mutase